MDEKSDSKRTFKKFLNTSQKDKNLSKYYVNEEDEDIYNNNDLFEELKNLNSNRIKNGNSKRNNVSSKNNIYENDFVNNTLLNLESNKLYHKNINLKKVNTIDSANVTQKNKDKKLNNTNITNQVKNEKKNDSIILKDKKRDTLKNTQKGNIKLPKNKQNNADSTKYRNSCKPKVVFDKHIVEETKNKFSKTSRNKFLNGSLPKGRISKKKINSNKMLIDTGNNYNNMSIETNYLNTNTNMNDNNFNKTKREENHLLLSLGKHLYKGQNRVLAMNESGRSNKNNSNKKKNFGRTVIKEYMQNYQNRSEININTKRTQNKIKIQDYMKTILLLNEYLINNNLFEDYSNPDNKEMIDNFSIFLANNIKIDYTDYSFTDKSLQNDKKIKAALKIQRKWRKKKFDDFLEKNTFEENEELKKICINKVVKKIKTKNSPTVEIIDDIINNYKLIYNNIEEVDKVFYHIQKIIQF